MEKRSGIEKKKKKKTDEKIATLLHCERLALLRNPSAGILNETVTALVFVFSSPKSI